MVSLSLAAMREQVQGLATAVVESYAEAGRRQASLEIMCEWARLLLKHLPPGHVDRPPVCEALSAVEAIAKGKPEQLLLLLREWPGAPMIGDMSRRQIVAEMRDACDSFGRGQLGTPALVASVLGHWAIDTVERPNKAEMDLQETALALLAAVGHAAGDAADAALAACADVLRARLPPIDGSGRRQ